LRPLLPLVLTACVTPIDLAEKRCPCAPGWLCAPLIDRCVESPCAVAPAAFRAEWATTNTIRYRWSPAGDRSKFVRYELHLAASAAQIGTSAEQVFGPAQNEELGSFALPFTSGTNDLVEATHATGLMPQTSYAAQLWVYDSALCVAKSDAIAITTKPDLPNEVVIYRDAPPAGAGYAPPSFRDVADQTGPGRHLEWMPSQDPTCVEAVCGNNLKVRSFAVSLAHLRAGGFANAMLELRISNDGTSFATFARTWLVFGPGCSEIFRLEPMTIPRSIAYTTLQVPLTGLRNDALRPLAYEDVGGDGGHPACEFNVGGRFTRASADGGMTRVRVDDVRVRY